MHLLSHLNDLYSEYRYHRVFFTILFTFFFESTHHYWLDSLLWLAALGKYARYPLAIEDRCTGELPALPAFLHRFTPFISIFSTN